MNGDKDNPQASPSSKPIALTAMNLKHQLKFFLDQRGFTASHLAKKANVPKQSISGWISGNNPRDVRQVKRVADVLGVSLDHLLFGHGDSHESRKVTELDALLGEGWISGLFEVRFRRIKK